MTSDAQMRCQSLESSILFMQQQHASTLKGLHEEIHKLQQRCSELTFQLAMDATSLPDKEDYKEKSEKLATELEEKTNHMVQLEEELTKRDKKNKLLEQQVKAQAKKYSDELKRKDQCIAGLQAELESKSGNIAYLTAQLHKLKAKSQAKSHDLPQQKDVQPVKAYNPSPPKEAAPKSGGRRRGRAAGSESEQLLSSVKVRPASGRPLPDKPNTPETIPDPTPFLSRDNSVRPAGQLVLPPIGRSFEENAATGLPVAPPQQRDSNMFMKRRVRGATRVSQGSPEVEVMAVEEVHKRDTSVRRAREYHSPD